MESRNERPADEHELPIDAPEADAAEQAEPWTDDEEEGSERRPRVPLDAPEADTLDQWRAADLEEDEYR